MGFLDRLRQGLSRTKEQIVSRFDEIVQQADTAEQRTRPVDVDTIEDVQRLMRAARPSRAFFAAQRIGVSPARPL